VPVDPLVSVLLPVWNGERFLRASIDSIASQTFRAFELIVISDGSTDGSLEIAREAAGLDSRIVVLPLPHDGLPAALNAGIAAARGAYLARMDADDLAVPARLERQVAYLDAHPHCVVVGSAVDVVDAQDEHHPGADLELDRRLAALAVLAAPAASSRLAAQADVLLHGPAQHAMDLAYRRLVERPRPPARFQQHERLGVERLHVDVGRPAGGHRRHGGGVRRIETPARKRVGGGAVPGGEGAGTVSAVGPDRP